MDEKKMTNREALDAAIEELRGNAEPALIEKLEKMLAAMSKPKKKSEGPSKTKLENQRLAQAVADTMPEETPVTLKWVTEFVTGIMTSQKARYVMEEGVALGLFERIEPDKKSKPCTYILA